MARLLKQGLTGNDVRELQAALNFHLRPTLTPEQLSALLKQKTTTGQPATAPRLVPLKTDGIFGPGTDSRLRIFQKAAGIKDDGIAGPITTRFLLRAVEGIVTTVVEPTEPLARSGAPAFAFAGAGGRGSAGGVSRGLRASPGGSRSPRLAFGANTVGQIIPDFVPPSARRPQFRAVQSESFEFEGGFQFDPLADSKEHPLKLDLAIKLPWPIFLPPKLELKLDPSADGRFKFDAEIKVPFHEAVQVGPLSLGSYFSGGLGVGPTSPQSVSAGAGVNLKLQLFRGIFGNGTLSAEADGGTKFEYDVEEQNGKFKGILNGGLKLEFSF